MQAMKRRQAVCCEKPLALRGADARALRAASEKKQCGSVYSIPPAVQHEYREALV